MGPSAGSVFSLEWLTELKNASLPIAPVYYKGQSSGTARWSDALDKVRVGVWVLPQRFHAFPT